MALGVSFGCLVWSAVGQRLLCAQRGRELAPRPEPLIYKITGTWGNHEGSILLWCLILAMCGAAVAACSARDLPSSLRARVIGVLGIVRRGFLLFALTAIEPVRAHVAAADRGAAT